MNKIKFLLLSTFLLWGKVSFAQLTPGFSPKEYKDFLGITAGSVQDSAFRKGIPQNQNLKRIYESPLVGLDNKWYLWVNKPQKIAWLTIRGTANNPTSWLANFYSAMIPAKGMMKISDTNSFEYNFSNNPKAAVHVGWTLSTGALAETLVPKMDSLYQAGYRDFVVSGHSQGGAISYLMTAHLYHLKESGRWPEPIRIKTYASAAPKPGNLYFAYHYEYITRGGWAYNVVNGADWVPETPFSVQTVKDFNTINPFTDASAFISKQKFPQKLIFRKVYNNLNKPTEKAKKNFQKYLGEFAGKQVTKNLPEYQSPEFFNSNHFTRAGNFIVLNPDEEYSKIYPDDKEKVFRHHGLQPYLFLLERQYPE
ncbi:lipase family protein [Algoriphagus lacus]|uniref:Lipase family protein n=1 Tax=Algoriphagus lacus TaxID=2056311 RepID=A0A418PSG9_9BACT|nr:lipase family protein [Algoriphagus lacus]RIW15755.1 lipase family protein [Algoriphagus lacus]